MLALHPHRSLSRRATVCGLRKVASTMGKGSSVHPVRLLYLNKGYFQREGQWHRIRGGVQKKGRNASPCGSIAAEIKDVAFLFDLSWELACCPGRSAAPADGERIAEARKSPWHHSRGRQSRTRRLSLRRSTFSTTSVCSVAQRTYLSIRLAERAIANALPRAWLQVLACQS